MFQACVDEDCYMSPPFEDRRSRYLQCFEKTWDKRVWQDGRPVDETTSFEGLQEVNPADRNTIRLILKPYDDDVISHETERVTQFCGDTCLSDLKDPQIRKNLSAWLDERTHPGNHSPNGNSRRSPTPLHVLALYEQLEEQRYSHNALADVDKRLIYIANIDRYYAATILWTASEHQVPALRDALFRHLALQTSLRVQITLIGVPTFRLEFHMPYFALRRNSRKLSKQHRQQIDLSFLDFTQTETVEQQSSEIHEAHISVVTCGLTEKKWTTYCFDDNEFNPDHEMGEDEFIAIKVDQIFNNPRSDTKADANFPIWDPREYFLATVLVRISHVLEEWRDLVCFIEPKVIRHTNKRSFSTENLEAEVGTMGTEDAFQWTQQTLGLLGDLIETLRRSHQALVKFTSVDGDVGYFVDVELSTSQTQRRMRESVLQIKAVADDMHGLQGRLEFIQGRCEKLFRSLELRSNFENMKEAKWSGSSVDVTILGISPVVISCAFFSIPDPIISFQKNLLSFTISISIITLVLYIALRMKRGDTRHHPSWSRLRRGARYIWTDDRSIVTTRNPRNEVLPRRPALPESPSESIEMV